MIGSGDVPVDRFPQSLVEARPCLEPEVLFARRVSSFRRGWPLGLLVSQMICP